MNAPADDPHFTQGGDVVVIASRFGREKQPARHSNDMAHPEVTSHATGRHAAREVRGA